MPGLTEPQCFGSVARHLAGPLPAEISARTLRAIRAWGATTVVTLIDDHEFRLLRIESLADEVRALGMKWVHLPIVDVSLPDGRFEDAWVSDGPPLHGRLDAGEKY